MGNAITVIDWIKLALRRDIFLRSIKVAVIVGTLLAAINHGDSLLALTIDTGAALKILLTYLVPFCVATWSAVEVARNTPAPD